MTLKFETVCAISAALIDKFESNVPNTLDFIVGYMKLSGQAKVWLMTSEYIKSKYSQGNTLVWWEDRV